MRSRASRLSYKEEEEESTSVEASKMGFCSLLLMIYFLVCGGAYGTEDLGSSLPPLYAILGILLCPWLFGFPLAMICAELSAAMPDSEGFMLWTESKINPCKHH